MSEAEARQEGRNRFVAVVLLAIVVAAAAVLAGCGGSGSNTSQTASTEPAPANQETSEAELPVVNWAFPGEPIETLSGLTGGLGAISVSMNVGEGLVAMDAEGHVHNALASSWKQETPTSYTYTLRNGAKFSDGTPVTVADVLYSLSSVINPKTGGAYSGLFPNIKSFTSDGTNKIKMTLKHPDASGSFYLSSYAMNIYEKKELISAHSTPGQPKGTWVGTGPYEVEEFGPESVVLVRNKYFAGSKPKAAKVVVHFIADNATRLAAIEAGEIDGTFQVPETEVERWQKLQGSNLVVGHGPVTQNFFFNMQNAPLSDVHARRAIMYAFDRQSVVEKLLHDKARVANAVVAPEMWVAEELTAAEVEERSDELGPDYSYSPEKAKAELAKSPYPNGFSTSVEYDPADNPEMSLAMQVFQEDLKQVGINVKLNPVSAAQMAPEFTAAEPKFEIQVRGGAPNFPSVAATLPEAYCGCTAPPNGFNNGGYENPQLDEEINAATADLNAQTRADKVFHILATANSELPSATLWWKDVIASVGKSLVLKEFGPWTELQTPWMANLYAAG